MKDLSVEVPDGHINVWHRPAATGSPTAVLVHGLTGTSRWWTRVIEHLPPEIGLVVPDVRGRGASYGSPPPFDLPTLADDIVRSLDHLGVDQALVAGYSMGAWVAALCAQGHPDRVRRALLVDGGFRIPSHPNVDAETIIEAVVGPSLARLEVNYPDREAFFDLWKTHPAFEKHWEDAMKTALEYELVESEDGYRVRINPDSVRETARQITVDPDTNDAGAEVRVRTHLIVVERGTADQEGGMIPLQTAEKAAMEMPNLTMQYLPGVNHYTLLLGAGVPAVAGAIASTE